MNTRKTPVNLTFGQLYDAVSDGEVFFDDSNEQLEIQYGLVCTIYNGQTAISEQLRNGLITQLAHRNWTEQLDNTWKNGVWCKVWDVDDQEYAVEKIISFDNEHYPYQSYSTGYSHAEPIDEALAQQLEELFDER